MPGVLLMLIRYDEGYIISATQDRGTACYIRPIPKTCKADARRNL